MGKKVNRSKSRRSRVGSADTLDGAQGVEAAGQWWQAFNARQGKDVLQAVMEPDHPKFLTGNYVLPVAVPAMALPGYRDALNSARDALLTLWGRTQMVREIYQVSRKHEEGSMGFVTGVALALAGYGGALHGPAMPHADKWHESQGTRVEFTRERLIREANAAKKPLPNFGRAPVADLPLVATTLVQLWVGAGFWLCSFEDIAPELNGKIPVGRGKGTAAVTAANLKRIASELKLVRYRPTYGTGQAVVQDGAVVADPTLLAEMRCAREEVVHQNGSK